MNLDFVVTSCNGVTIELSTWCLLRPCLKKLTFEKLGLSEKSPFLFQTIRLLFYASLSTVESAIKVYGTNLDLCLGTRYTYALSPSDTPVAILKPLATAKSTVLAAAVASQTMFLQELEFIVATSIQSQMALGAVLLVPLAPEDLDLL